MSSRHATLLIGAIGLAAVALALTTQHLLGMLPCPWCVAQRVVFLAMTLVGLLGLVGERSARSGLAFQAAFGAFGAGLALWQHFVAAKSVSCAFTAADKFLAASRLDRMLPGVFEPKASCADGAVALLGVPYEFWSLALFVGLAGWAVRVVWGRRSA